MTKERAGEQKRRIEEDKQAMLATTSAKRILIRRFFLLMLNMEPHLVYCFQTQDNGILQMLAWRVPKWFLIATTNGDLSYAFVASDLDL